MDRIGLRGALALILALAPGSVLAGAGYVLHEDLVKTAADGSTTRESTRTFLVAGKLRKEQTPGSSVTIARDDRKAFWVLDTSKRTYFELDRETMRAMGEAGMAMLVGGTTEDAASWLRKTGETKRVGAWQAYEVRAEDRPLPGVTISLWLSTEVPIDRAFRDQFGDGPFAGGGPAAGLLAGLRELEGYPVEVVLTARLGAQVLEVRQTLRSVEKAEVPDSAFDLPAGFERVETPFAGLAGAPAR